MKIFDFSLTADDKSQRRDKYPACILADEPTGNLDHETAGEIFDCLVDLARREKCAVLIVTHDRELAGKCDRILQLENGRILVQK